MARQPALESLRARIGAEKARRGKRTARSRIILAAAVGLALAVAALFSYYITDYFRYFGKWQQVFHRDFTLPGARTDDLSYCTYDIMGDDPGPAPGPRGLPMPVTGMYWFDSLRVSGAVRFEVKLRWVTGEPFDWNDFDLPLWDTRNGIRFHQLKFYTGKKTWFGLRRGDRIRSELIVEWEH